MVRGGGRETGSAGEGATERSKLERTPAPADRHSPRLKLCAGVRPSALINYLDGMVGSAVATMKELNMWQDTLFVRASRR